MVILYLSKGEHMSKTSVPNQLKKNDKLRKLPKLDEPLSKEQQDELNILHGIVLTSN
jgi:hypothetical protein